MRIRENVLLSSENECFRKTLVVVRHTPCVCGGEQPHLSLIHSAFSLAPSPAALNNLSLSQITPSFERLSTGILTEILFFILQTRFIHRLIALGIKLPFQPPNKIEIWFLHILVIDLPCASGSKLEEIYLQFCAYYTY